MQLRSLLPASILSSSNALSSNWYPLIALQFLVSRSKAEKKKTNTLDLSVKVQ